MTDEILTAQRLVRRFARETNLLVAGRNFVVVGTDAVADELRTLLPALGARLADDGVVFAPGQQPDIRLDDAPLPPRKTAADRVDAAGRHMPVATALATRLRDAGTVGGIRIGIAMVLEPKTAQLALLLRDAGAEVAVYAHPDEIDIEVAEVLRTRGIPVDGDPALTGTAERAAAVSFLSRGFDLLLDDGSHLIRLSHELDAPEAPPVPEAPHEPDAPDAQPEAPHEPDAPPAPPKERFALRGAAEETTSGLAPLRLMEREGLLEIPVIAVNDATAKTSFDNRYGTGQSCVFAIADVLDAAGIDLRDQPAVVVGYGPVGEGVAAHLTAFGVSVAVSETDPVRALRAAHDGYRIGRLRDLAPGALVVSATGAPHTVDTEIVRVAAIVAVAGGVPHEVDLDPSTLRAYAGESGEPTPFVERAGSGALVIARGGCVNLAAGEGNPIEIMDLSFSVQLAAVDHLLSRDLPPGVHRLPPAIDAEIGAAALAARDERIDERSEAQQHALRDWRSQRFRNDPA